MQFLNDINESLLVGALVLPLALCVLVMLLNTNHRETSGLAVRNTFTTLAIFTINLVFLVLLIPSVDERSQALYNAANIPTLPDAFWEPIPWVVTAIVAFLAGDIANYTIHRLMHRKWLWPTHAAHHSDTHVNAFTTFRIHALESILMSLTNLIMFTWMQIPWQLPLVVFVGRVFNMYVHMDLPWTHGRFRYVFASPVFHRWHHADTPAAHGKNLANMFPFIDVIFGTYHEAEVTSIPMGAKSSNINDLNPLKITVYPFVQWGRLIRSQWKTAVGPTHEPPRPVEAPAVVDQTPALSESPVSV